MPTRTGAEGCTSGVGKRMFFNYFLFSFLTGAEGCTEALVLASECFFYFLFLFLTGAEGCTSGVGKRIFAAAR